MTFRASCTIAVMLFAALCFVLLLVPSLIFWLFQLELNTPAEVMARRAGAIFAGLAVLIWGLRDLPAGATRNAVSLGLAVMMFMLAGLGLIEFILGRVGAGIFLAIVAELGSGVLFLKLR